jgi:hypothetical protein
MRWSMTGAREPISQAVNTSAHYEVAAHYLVITGNEARGRGSTLLTTLSLSKGNKVAANYKGV